MFRFPAPASPLPRLANPDLLIDDFQRVSLSCPHSRSAQKRAQGAHVAPLPAYDFSYITFRHFQFDYVVIEMVHVHFIGSIDDPLRNLLDENANVSSGLSHGGLLRLR